MAIGSPAHALKTDGFTDLRERTAYQAGAVSINVARHSGYCWGVQRAYDQTIAHAREGSQPVSTFGPLIHNPQTIRQLSEDYKIRVLNDVAEFTKGRVIIRTHGVPLEIQDQLRERGAEVIDATCPYVRVSQNYAAMLNRERYHVVIVGDPNHPEVQSILSYARGEGTVVRTPDDVAKIPRGTRRIGVVVQSTMILALVNDVVAKLTGMTQELRVFNTICYVTDERQSDAEMIARSNELVVVIGGRTSSNTKKLAVVAERNGARAVLVEGPDDLEPSQLLGVPSIGILAGASTPNWLIDDVVATIEHHINDAASANS